MFKAGFARVDITPPLGTPLAGYFAVRHAERVLDPLELNAIAVSDDKTTAVYITADVLYVRRNACDPLRQMIAERVNLPVENIFVQGLHQHTSVRVGGKPTQLSNLDDKAYLDVLYRKFCDVAQLAIADLSEAKAGVAEKETARPVSYVRRFRMKDGTTRTNPGNQNPDVLGPLSDADNTVRLIRFFREGKKDIALVNFSTHPDVVGGKNISADWPGFVRRFTEAEFDAHCMMATGAQGDTNHVNVNDPPIAVKGDPNNLKNRYTFSRNMARTIVDTVHEIWDNTEAKEAAPISCHNRLEYIPTNTKYIDEIDRFREMKKAYDAGELKLQLGPLAEMCRVVALYEESLFQIVPASVLGMGQMAIAGFGGEPFTWYAHAARASAPDLFVLGACLVNGGEGYLPTKEAFEEGGYEAVSTRFTPCVAEKIPAAIADMIRLHKETK